VLKNALNARKYLVLVTVSLFRKNRRVYNCNLRNHERKRRPIISSLRANVFSTPFDDSVDDENLSMEFHRYRVYTLFIRALVILKLDCCRCTVYTQHSCFQSAGGDQLAEQSRSFTERVLAFLNFTP